jgi:hypothetical protein
LFVMTAAARAKKPSAVICNATRNEVTCTIFVQYWSGQPASGQNYTIPVGSCFYTSDAVTVQEVHIGYQIDYDPYTGTRQSTLKDKVATGASSASPCSWVVTEEAGAVQLKRSNGIAQPYCWHISVGSSSYDARDQATVEAWQHDAATRREGVKHIITLCQEATGAMPASPDVPSPVARLLAVLRNIPPSYSASDFAYVPLTTTLDELMASTLPEAQLHELARILRSKGVGPDLQVASTWARLKPTRPVSSKS